MASPVQAPPPQVPLPPRQPRSLAGPVVLIVLGIVFLMGTMGLLNWHRLGIWFAHYWPVLIIVWGVIKLVEYQSAQKHGLRPRGIGAGGVFLLIVLIVCGFVATQATRFNWEEIGKQIDIGDEDIPFFGHSYTYDDRLQQDWPAGANLHVVDDHGAVNISTSNDPVIHITIRKRIRAENQGDADKWNAGAKPQINTSGQTVTVNANTQGAGDHWIATDLDIVIPRKASVTISNQRGNVSVLGRDGDLQLSNQHGQVTASDINGKVNLDAEHSSARITQIASDVSIQGHLNDVSVEDVKGSVRLNGEFVDGVKLSRIAKTVSFKSSRTDLELAKLDGDLTLDSDDLRASNLTGPLRVSTRSKDIHLEGVSGDVRVDDERGDIELRIVKLGNIQVDHRSSGDLQIYVPDKASFQVDARSRDGEIQSDFPQLKIDNNNNLATTSGTVGAGGPRIVINNEHGTVEIRRGSSAAQIPEPPAAPKTPKLPSRGSGEVEPTEQ